MSWYTVIGYYDDNGASYANFYEAKDALAAMNVCALEHADSPELVIVGAIAGQVELEAPCESGATAFACDMPARPEQA